MSLTFDTPQFARQLEPSEIDALEAIKWIAQLRATDRVEALLIAAVFLWARRHVARPRGRDVSGRARVWLLVTGVGVGVLTGVVGVGGGFLIVPALVMFGGYTALDAVPISLFAITFSAATAAVGYRAVPVAWGTVLVMAAAASSGVLAGGAIGRRLNPAHLQAVFAIVLLGASGYIFLAR